MITMKNTAIRYALWYITMTSLHSDTHFYITGRLRGEYTCNHFVPLAKRQGCEVFMFPSMIAQNIIVEETVKWLMITEAMTSLWRSSGVFWWSTSIVTDDGFVSSSHSPTSAETMVTKINHMCYLWLTKPISQPLLALILFAGVSTRILLPHWIPH